MLSIFPSLLSWEQISPTLLRIVLGVIFIFWAYKAYKREKSDPRQKALGIIEGVAGILLFIGLWTQLAALYAIIDLAVRLIERIRNKAFLTDGVNYYLILLVIAICLLVSGAGVFGFDMPL